MIRAATSLGVFCILLLIISFTSKETNFARASGPGSPLLIQTGKEDADSFVYADFERVENARPVSNHGGLVQLISYHESTPSHFKGIEGASPPAPRVVKLKKDDPNRAITFDYQLFGTNQYAGVGVEVHGEPDKDGKPVPDDLGGYKYLSMQIYATGVPDLRVEIISKDQGTRLTGGFPQMSFKVKPGFNTYKFPLSYLEQPSWVDTRISTKDVLKKLTAVSLTAFCDKQCTSVSGKVLVDNIVFQKN